MKNSKNPKTRASQKKKILINTKTQSAKPASEPNKPIQPHLGLYVPRPRGKKKVPLRKFKFVPLQTYSTLF